ncbi:acyl-CoA thioesterase II [Auraticoccus sp. F435]|uniref:Acyl-CoA thioesterase 2 n=1 Tax=Auraticoccus cholistanensis TaxID=2656650 RepID=A0A6A9USA7_9ACTN|nr:acyl-CoA thioesterase II [Auraticoccus cholistanensis]MVA75693.1 acyl-CoA thioesterase II [Auraticoccus cholistanensis]
MPASVEELVQLLELEQIELTLYRGSQPATHLQRAFGGQVLAQALTAAQHTLTSDMSVHSLHAYFLKPGRTDAPIIYDVELLREGRSFATRRVLARQGGAVIFTVSVSFHTAEDGLEHQDPEPADVPAPLDCPRLSEAMEALSGRRADTWEAEWGALDVRYAGDSRPGGVLSADDHPARARVWMKVAGELGDDPRRHQAALAYASDLTLLAVSVVPHPVLFGGPGLQAASIDHSMWFHRPFRADRWLLYDQVSPSARSSLGLSTGRLFQDGQLVATVAQEGLIRVVDPR